ncbi:DNA repair exonuclease rad1 [Mytilinidion resinicola]|uniref:DNA repair exonuclease rad1 n=1 Tax=Mytilinidion resinicola TaxID=574789 RepID=A0A6A6YHA0_9PEZI|nr:DNA repair exonuclease rad1 [Mytilinidion resinicola]KAF2808181.1 DNA repair exonuclease rad1 [Mytilinidion resinicola]
MSDLGVEEGPIFSAISASARQLFLLLRCIGFADKAQVQISEEGLRFSVEESSVMEGLCFLEKSLFTSYVYNSTSARPSTPISQDSDATGVDQPIFQISLPSLLETLQIFGLTDPNTNRPPWARDNHAAPSTAFSSNVLGMNHVCRLGYDASGSPLSVILEESSIKTTCELTTYEPAFATDIPFSRKDLALKIIMRASWLHDAITELASTSPTRLTLVARMQDGKPYFALSASGSLGSARVEFNNAKATTFALTATNTVQPDTSPSLLLETFQLADPTAKVVNSYKFDMIQKAARAMAVATKVSVRGDAQGVLSLQFMIEVEAGKVSFVDFRFVPFVFEEGDEGDEVDNAVVDDEVDPSEDDL